MTLATHTKLIEYDTKYLKLHMEQCEKEHCIKKSIINALRVSCNFIIGRTITSLTLVLLGMMCIILII